MTATDPLLVDLLQRVKSETESRSKTDLHQFLQEYRRLFERPGLSDDEFWTMVEVVGIRPVST
jgi:hypothetical protein